MSGNEGCQIMEFRPSMEEFKNFSAYIQKMESLGAHKGGIAKVIPPTEWFACRRYNMKKIGEMTIEAPVGQVVTGQQGLYQQFNVQKKPLKVKEFKELAESPKYIGPECEDLAKIERKYWKNITFNPPIYGADMPGSVYDSSVDVWNINRLHTILDILDTECSVKIQGVNTAYLYFGMWKTTFAWHTEDMDLYSINFLHFGAPKSWYAIPPEHGKRLESLAKGFFSGSAQDCPEFLRHKMTIISPQVLKRFSIPVNKITQYSGEFIITFPFGYHSGYNHGFNCAESTNFASERWIEYGKRASHCQCNSDSVKIDMNVFIRKYQPELWQKTEFQSGRGKASETNNTRVAPRAKYASESPSKKKKKEYDESDTAVHAGDSLKNRSLDCEGANGVVQVQNEHTSFSKSSGRQLGKSVFQTSKRHPVFVKHLHQGDIQTDLDVKNEEDHCDMNVKAGAGPMRTSCSFLEGLWSHEPLDLEKERQYNKVMSSTEARCAVCVFFSASDAKFLFSGSDDSRDVAREHRRLSDSAGGLLLVTELCFAATHSEKSSMETAFKLLFACGQQEALAIITCADCQLTVHKSCYGLIEGTDQTQQTWYCDKCRALQEADGEETARSVRCCLCCLKGGALKRTTTGQWAHIVCGIGFPDVFFVDRQARGPIDISLLNPARRKLNCVYCNEFTRQTSVDRGACVQCKCGKCAVAFHVTCSFHNGIPLYHGDWPVLIEALCMKHSKCKKPKVESKRNLVDVSVGDAVMAKHRNGRYYKATVQEVVKVLYYKVVFEDKSFCFDLPPHDIQGVDATSTLLALGTDVRVAWRDGLTYKANVTGHWYDTVCQVRFEDTSILNIKRNDLFAEKEEIPNKIRSKMSYASETANLLYIADSLKGTTKRTRVSSRKSCRGALEKL